jgi:hypothetical protein
MGQENFRIYIGPWAKAHNQIPTKPSDLDFRPFNERDIDMYPNSARYKTRLHLGAVHDIVQLEASLRLTTHDSMNRTCLEAF